MLHTLSVTNINNTFRIGSLGLNANLPVLYGNNLNKMKIGGQFDLKFYDGRQACDVGYAGRGGSVMNFHIGNAIIDDIKMINGSLWYKIRNNNWIKSKLTTIITTCEIY